MRLVLPIAALALLAAIACDDGPTEPRLGAAYRLVTVDGRPLPAAYDSIFLFDGSNRFFRITGRLLELVSADSADYAEATDVVERLAGGGFTPWTIECSRRRIAWRREGNRIILVGVPWTAPPMVRNDTLEMSGGSLIQWRREPPADDQSTGRVWRLTYTASRTSPSACAPPA